MNALGDLNGRFLAESEVLEDKYDMRLQGGETTTVCITFPGGRTHNAKLFLSRHPEQNGEFLNW